MGRRVVLMPGLYLWAHPRMGCTPTQSWVYALCSIESLGLFMFFLLGSFSIFIPIVVNKRITWTVPMCACLCVHQGLVSSRTSGVWVYAIFVWLWVCLWEWNLRRPILWSDSLCFLSLTFNPFTCISPIYVWCMFNILAVDESWILLERCTSYFPLQSSSFRKLTLIWPGKRQLPCCCWQRVLVSSVIEYEPSTTVSSNVGVWSKSRTDYYNPTNFCNY